MSRFSRLSMPVFLLFLLCAPALAQDDVTQARDAMSQGDYARAARILSSTITTQPSADAFLYLGISYAHTREWARAEDTLKQGSSRFPRDSRFHNELAGVYLASNDLNRARESLRTALTVDPNDKYAADLLATVDMSMGNVQGALKAWNRDGRPVIGEILNNGHVEFENWIIHKASAFRTGDTLTWNKWRTTEVRLENAWIFSNAGIEIEPTKAPDRYTAVIRTTKKTTGRSQAITALLEAAFFKAPSLRLWNIKNSGISAKAGYRFATNRHRGEAGFMVPLPLPGLVFMEATGFFRSERWDISRPAIDTGIDHRFLFKASGGRLELKHIPYYRLELGAGFEYRNRTASGSQPGLALDSRNTGKLLFQASLLPFDGRYRGRLHAETFIAREAWLSDIRYSGGTVEWNSRYSLDKESRNTLELTVKTGTTRGEVPVDDYFVLGLRPPTYPSYSDTFLRGHSSISQTGHFGSAPMGTSFTLVNTTFDRRIRRLPFFNVLDAPFVDLKWLVFADGARTFDRAHVFNEGKILVDVGGGFRLETPTRTFNLTYGRSLRDGTGTMSAYVGKKW